jgi:hypothetical protein
LEVLIVTYWTNTLEDLIRGIKIWINILVVVVFEGGMLIRMWMKEYIIYFFKMVFGVMLINLLLHPILSDDNIIFESMEHVGMRYKGIFNLIYLRES